MAEKTKHSETFYRDVVISFNRIANFSLPSDSSSHFIYFTNVSIYRSERELRDLKYY